MRARPLLVRLAREPRFRKIVGIELSAEAIRVAKRRLCEDATRTTAAVSLIHGSFTAADKRLVDFDAAAMVETIEHLDPDQLSAVEKAVFDFCRPATVIITTPNRKYNDVLGVPKHRFRHRDHRFEWGRAKFKTWACGVADRNGYCVAFDDIGGAHPIFGGPTQMATFRRRNVGVRRLVPSPPFAARSPGR